MLTVGELINELKKYPKDLRVGYQAHDNHNCELNDSFKAVKLIDFDKEKKDELNPGGKWVILRS